MTVPPFLKAVFLIFIFLWLYCYYHAFYYYFDPQLEGLFMLVFLLFTGPVFAITDFLGYVGLLECDTLFCQTLR